MCFSAESRILKSGRKFFRGGRPGADFLWRGRERADFEGLYYQSRSDCTRPEAVIGWAREGAAPSRLGGPWVLSPEIF